MQRSLIRSHAAGMGPAGGRGGQGDDAATRPVAGVGIFRACPVVVDRIVDLLNAGITPPVPEHGSLGASGDLALSPASLCA